MKVLWMVAPQIDYGPGGAMEIPGATELWASWVQLAPAYDELWLSLETHPADHISFASMHPWRKPGQHITFQGKKLQLNITHCVGGSFGAMLSADFQQLDFARKFHFGMEKMEEPKFFFKVNDLEKKEIPKSMLIEVVGVSHTPIIQSSVNYLKSLGTPIELKKDQSIFPEKDLI